MKPGFYNTGMIVDGVKQLKGYECDQLMQVPYLTIGSWVLSYKAIYDFTLNPLHPLTFLHPAGVFIRPDRHFQTDRMSNPKCTQWIWERDRFLGAFFHDSTYCHGGLWMARGASWKSVPELDETGTIKFLPKFEFQEMSRLEADNLLAVMIRHDPAPGSRLSAAAIWLGVRLGGWASWQKGDFRDPPEARNKIDTTKPAIMLG